MVLDRGVAICIVAASIWTPSLNADIAQRWLSWPNVIWLTSVPLVTALVVIVTSLLFHGTSEGGPFLCAVALFLMSYLGIAISLWPMIVPHHYTLAQAAASPKTQAFLLPTVLLYTAWAYWVSRGKVRANIGYH